MRKNRLLVAVALIMALLAILVPVAIAAANGSTSSITTRVTITHERSGQMRAAFGCRRALILNIDEAKAVGRGWRICYRWSGAHVRQPRVITVSNGQITTLSIDRGAGSASILVKQPDCSEIPTGTSISFPVGLTLSD